MALSLSAALTGCAPEPDRGPLVLAASSLQGPLDRAAEAWAADGHARPVLSYAGTPALARQVEAGAPADLFVSADEAWMDELEEERLIASDSRAVLATNALALVAASGQPPLSPADRMSLAPLRVGGRIAMGDPDSVPAGRYAKAALTRLGLWSAVAPRIVPTENVRAALALVERGAVPLGLVYLSDARQSQRVTVVAQIPPTVTGNIFYPIARLTQSRHRDAEAFRLFLLDEEAQIILQDAGMGAPRMGG